MTIITDTDELAEFCVRQSGSSFIAVDTLGHSIKVVYRNPKPENFDVSEKLVLQGKYENGLFNCKTIQTKCPSKYKDDANAVEKNVQDKTSSETGTTDKY